MNSWVLQSNQRGSEQNLGCSGLIRWANVDFGAVWQTVVICVYLRTLVVFSTNAFVCAIGISILAFARLILGQQCRVVVDTRFARLQLRLAVQFLDLANDLKLGCRAERVARSLQKQDQVLSDISAAQVNPPCRVLDREALVDCARVTAPISNIDYDTRRKASGVQTEHTRRVKEDLGHLEVFKEHACRPDPVPNRIVRWLRQQHWVFSWVYFELFKNMSPDSLHVIPVLNDATLHRVAQLEDSLEFFLKETEFESLRLYLRLTACCPMNLSCSLAVNMTLSCLGRPTLQSNVY